MVQVTNNHPRLRFSRSETQRAIRTVLQREKRKLQAVSVVFVSSRFIRGVNRKFLHHDYVTDVISFQLKDGLGVDAELYINLDRARSQAKEFKVGFTEEVLRLVIHGTLHLIGYNDNNTKNRGRMRRREEFYLSRLTNKG